MCGGRGTGGRRRPEAAGAAARAAEDNDDDSAGGRAGGGGRARRCRLPRAVPLAVFVVGVAWGSTRAAAQRGYDKEETPTGIWKGECHRCDSAAASIDGLCRPPSTARSNDRAGAAKMLTFYSARCRMHVPWQDTAFQ